MCHNVVHAHRNAVQDIANYTPFPQGHLPPHTDCNAVQAGILHEQALHVLCCDVGQIFFTSSISSKLSQLQLPGLAS